MPTDSLFVDQWYLTDAKVIPVWKDYTGKGVRIGQFEPSGPYAVSKEILDYRQSDLQANIHAGAGNDIVQVVGDAGVTLNLTQAEVEIAVGGRGNDVLIVSVRESPYRN